MESKIYSRPRFCTTGKGYKNMPRNNRRYTAISIITIIVIAVITFVIITRAVNPIINDLCIDKAKNIATQISNDEATLIMNQYSYDDLITIVRDSNGNVKMLQTNLELVNNCLIKTKNIIEQSKLNKEDRQQNIQGVYSIQNEEIITNKKVLLIDDIYTTGSTVNECSKILQQARPERIGVLVLAKD